MFHCRHNKAKYAVQKCIRYKADPEKDGIIYSKATDLWCILAMSACDGAHCSDVCLLNDQGSYTCACSAGKKLDYDKRTCIGN